VVVGEDTQRSERADHREAKGGKEKHSDDINHGGEGSEAAHKGLLIVDATCAPEGMQFLHDVTLLNDARRKTEAIIDTLQEHDPDDVEKPRTYRKKREKSS
jgi:IS5 family transposase